MTCEELTDRLDAYALGALDPEERLVVETHLAVCEGCAAQATESERAAVALALAAPLRRPAPALRDRVMMEARRDLATGAARRRTRMAGWRMRALGAAAAVAVLALAGVTAWAVSLQREVDDLRSRNTELLAEMDREAIVSSVMASGRSVAWEMAGTDTAPGATAVLAWDPEERLCVLVAERLPLLPEGQVYQLWLTKDDGTPVSMGTFDVDADGAGRLVATLDGEFWGYVSAGVSREPAGGSTERSGPVVLASSLSEEDGMVPSAPHW